ncbi:MAG: urease accessory protein UreF [Planctomycetota bacterium]|nr:urease accessory protein UreF [Planctomycetota bacterium]
MGIDPVPEILPLLHLASPALPIGAFAWSQGLAGAVDQGAVRDTEGLAAWLGGILRYGLARFDLPLLKRCWLAARRGDGAALEKWNAEILAGRETAELWEEESRLGAALWRMLRGQKLIPAWVGARPAPGHVCAFAAAAVFLGGGSGAEDGWLNPARAFAWSWLENQIQAALKTMPLGQTAAGRVLLALMPRIEDAVAAAGTASDGEIGASLAGQALASIAHEGQRARMFRS